MERYRTPPIAAHSPRRRPLGVRTAVDYRDSTAATRPGPRTGHALPLDRPATRARLSCTAAARRAFERQYATIEITDSVATMGGHQVGADARLSRAAAAGRAGAGGRRAERLLALPRDDRHPRQGRRRRAARPASGHGVEPAAVARAGAAARAQQAPAGHGGRDDEHAARDVAGRPTRRTTRSVAERAMRCARGGSRKREDA